MHAWVLDKSKSLGLVLIAQKALRPDKHHLLDALVEAHVEQHGNTVEHSLDADSPSCPLCQELERIADLDVQTSLLFLSTVRATWRILLRNRECPV
jgi:hypothetical protein